MGKRQGQVQSRQYALHSLGLCEKVHLFPHKACKVLKQVVHTNVAKI